MTGENELRLRTALRPEGWISDRPSTDEIGPAIPGACLEYIKTVGCVPDRARSAIVRTLVRRKKAAVGQEAEAIGIAQPPCHQRKFRAIRPAAHDRGRARH